MLKIINSPFPLWLEHWIQNERTTWTLLWYPLGVVYKLPSYWHSYLFSINNIHFHCGLLVRTICILMENRKYSEMIKRLLLRKEIFLDYALLKRWQNKDKLHPNNGDVLFSITLISNYRRATRWWQTDYNMKFRPCKPQNLFL